MTEGASQSPKSGPGRGRLVRVTVDPDVCGGTGNCVYWAPGTFELSDSGVAVANEDLSGCDEERIAVAAEGCPTGAISLEYSDDSAGTDRTD